MQTANTINSSLQYNTNQPLLTTYLPNHKDLQTKQQILFKVNTRTCRICCSYVVEQNTSTTLLFFIYLFIYVFNMKLSWCVMLYVIFIPWPWTLLCVFFFGCCFVDNLLYAFQMYVFIYIFFIIVFFFCSHLPKELPYRIDQSHKLMDRLSLPMDKRTQFKATLLYQHKR